MESRLRSLSSDVAPNQLRFHYPAEGLTLYAFQERWDVPCNDDQSLPELFCQAPLEHQVQHVVHVFRHAWPESGSQHGYTLEDGLFVGSILFAVNSTRRLALSTEGVGD